LRLDKKPPKMFEKQRSVGQFWHVSEEDWRKFQQEDFFNFDNQNDSLARFGGTHLEVMQERIGKMNWIIELKRASNASAQRKNSCSGSKKRRTSVYSIPRMTESSDQNARYPCCP
jgi:hypothetical protein